MSTSFIGPRSDGYAVVPARLHAARSSQELAAQVLAEVARSLAGLDVPTGRTDSADRCTGLLRELSVSLQTSAAGLRRAGADVSAAGSHYSAVDRACIGGSSCD